MTESPKQPDRWAGASLLLWAAFFLVGLEPERAFLELRDLSGVVTQNAWVNSPHLITVAFAAYLAWFVYARCLEAGISRPGAQGRAIQTAVLALVAFLGYPTRMLFEASYIPVPSLRWAVYLAIGAKLFSWLYLFGIILRYYGLGRVDVFAAMPVLFPSTRVEPYAEGEVSAEDEREAPLRDDAEDSAEEAAGAQATKRGG